MTREEALKLSSFVERFEKEVPLWTIDPNATMCGIYVYGVAVTEFIDLWTSDWDRSRMPYEAIKEDLYLHYQEQEWFRTLSETQVLQGIQYIIRYERFHEGFIMKMLENGVFKALLTRLKELHS